MRTNPAFGQQEEEAAPMDLPSLKAEFARVAGSEGCRM